MFPADYLSQVGVQVESLMDRKFLEDLSDSYKVHKRCGWLKVKKGRIVAVLLKQAEQYSEVRGLFCPAGLVKQVSQSANERFC